MAADNARESIWPELPLESWSETAATLQLWAQIAGKIRLSRTPWLNHSWHVTLYVTPRGLTTSAIPYGERTFEIEFEFLRQRLHITTSDGGEGGFALEPQTVAEFYRKIMAELARLGIQVKINRLPCELMDPIPFDQDQTHSAYQPEAAGKFWRILVQADRVFKMFRTRYLGKCSPVHFFWGAADLAVTRFSGRRAPMHPGGVPHLADAVTREAYSHEVSSAGFWAGGGAINYPAFYSYAYPEPEGFARAKVTTPGSFYSPDFHEFILPYDAVRTAADPDETLLDFLQSAYEAAADLGKWDRAGLERPSGGMVVGHPPANAAAG